MAPILPGRGVLNKKTFSFFENSKYDSLQRSFILSDVVIKPFALDTNCFEVKSKNDVKDSLVLCGCPFEPSSKDTAVNWIREILKFRDACPENMTGAIDLKTNDTVNVTIGNENVAISGDQLKNVAKSAVEQKMKDKEQEEDEREEKAIQDSLNQVESITAD